MPGLNLSAKATLGSSGVAAALPPSYAGSPAGATISARAYGVGSDGDSSGGPKTPAWGSVTVGVVSLAVLVYLWYSLPH